MFDSIYFFLITYLWIPLAHADAASQFLGKVNRHIINPIILVLFALAFVQFARGMLRFFQAQEKGSELKEAKNHMLWGIVGMAIMVSVFGIMRLLTGTLGLGDITGGLQKGGGAQGDISGLFKK